MKFVVATDRTITLAFEPTAAEIEFRPGDEVTVEWHGAVEDGRVEFEAGQLVIHAPTGGHTRAWNSAGVEMYIGADSGPQTR